MYDSYGFQSLIAKIRREGQKVIYVEDRNMFQSLIAKIRQKPDTNGTSTDACVVQGFNRS